MVYEEDPVEAPHCHLIFVNIDETIRMVSFLNLSDCMVEQRVSLLLYIDGLLPDSFLNQPDFLSNQTCDLR